MDFGVDKHPTWKTPFQLLGFWIGRWIKKRSEKKTHIAIKKTGGRKKKE